jgi:hypothetical protein
MVRNFFATVLSSFKHAGGARRITTLSLVLVLLLSLFLGAAAPLSANSLPYFDILSVSPGNSVTIKCFNFYTGISFYFLMGVNGTNGVGGINVGNANNSVSQVFKITLEIPYSLRNKRMVDLRVESPEGYYYYDSFYNAPVYTSSTSTSSTTTTYTYTGYIPTFDITAVTIDTSVAILTHNFPPGQTFTVRMGPYGSYGIGGTIVGTTDSGAGGSFAAVYSIPAALKGSNEIAIRMDSPGGYYAFNYFSNAPAATPVPVVPATYTGFPYFYISKVVKDSSVTIDGHNFPPSQTFTVTMGSYGSYGIGGIVIGTTGSDGGGNLIATYSVPAALAGNSLIAIRMESTEGYYAYNWFYNKTTP